MGGDNVRMQIHNNRVQITQLSTASIVPEHIILDKFLPQMWIELESLVAPKKLTSYHTTRAGVASLFV